MKQVWVAHEVGEGGETDDAVLSAHCRLRDGLIYRNDDELLELYKNLGARGEAESMFILALCYEFGWGTAINLNSALECYARAAELGSYEALWRFQDLKKNEAVKANLENIFRHFCLTADLKNARAQFNAGYCHFYGIGTPEDKEKAKKLFEKAAVQECADAMYMCEECREENIGDRYDMEKEVDLLKHAAEMGSAEAEVEMGYAYFYGYTGYGLDVPQDYKLAAEEFKKAAKQGHVVATHILAERYCEGNGEEKDVKRAFQLFKKAALMGHECAQCNMSEFYRHKKAGLSEDEYPVVLDYFEAAYWSSKAVDENYAEAKEAMSEILSAIGLLRDQIDLLTRETSSFESAEAWNCIAKQYGAGAGVEKDEQKAFEMYRLAARFGSVEARVALGRCYETGAGAAVDTDQAAYEYEKAARYGNIEAAESLLSLIRPHPASEPLKAESAFMELAQCYEAGNGVPGDEDAALLMREHAAACGDICAMREIVEIYSSGGGNRRRVGRVGAILASARDLPYGALLGFLGALGRELDELDAFFIARNAAVAVRGAIMAICINIY